MFSYVGLSLTACEMGPVVPRGCFARRLVGHRVPRARRANGSSIPGQSWVACRGEQPEGEEPGGYIQSRFSVSFYLGNRGWQPGVGHGLISAGDSPEPGEVPLPLTPHSLHALV